MREVGQAADGRMIDVAWVLSRIIDTETGIDRLRQLMRQHPQIQDWEQIATAAAQSWPQS